MVNDEAGGASTRQAARLLLMLGINRYRDALPSIRKEQNRVLGERGDYLH